MQLWLFIVGGFTVDCCEIENVGADVVDGSCVVSTVVIDSLPVCMCACVSVCMRVRACVGVGVVSTVVVPVCICACIRLCACVCVRACV